MALNLEDTLTKRLKQGKFTIPELKQFFKASSSDIHSSLEKIGEEFDIEKHKFKRRTFYFIKTSPQPFRDPYIETSLGKEGIFGLESDLHYGSMSERPDLEGEFLERCKSEGVETILNCGDMVDGIDVYRGQNNYLKVWGYDAQVEHLAKVRPKIDGLTTKFITGNHDLKGLKQTGQDPGNRIAELRDDMEYLGQTARLIQLPENVTIQLLHPGKGSAYAKSYHPQNYVRDMRSARKPNALFWGHQHDLLYFLTRNVHVIKAGTFQDETEFSIEKGFETTMGGCIVEYKIKDGEFDNFKVNIIPFYD